jgi:hypothetical protein
MSLFGGNFRLNKNGNSSRSNALFKVATPKRVSVGSLAKTTLSPIMASGIVNPFGPTFNILAVAGDQGGRRGELPVVHVMLNPFQQEAHRVGSVVLNRGISNHDMCNAAPMYFPAMGGGCPTLLMAYQTIMEDTSTSMFGTYLQGFEGGERVLQNVRQYPGNPADRVSAEMCLATQLEMYADGKRPPSSRNLSEAEALELAGLLLDPHNQKQEISAFLYAWNGSIDMQGGKGSHRGVMSFEEFLEWFGKIVDCCRVPALTNETATASSARSGIPRINIIRPRDDDYVDPDEEDDADGSPDYFAPAPSAAEACLRQIKGNYRRAMVQNALETDALEDVPPAWRTHNLSENLKKYLLNKSPDALGGEDLPDLDEGQVEIARLTNLDSVHGEVVSLRAERGDDDTIVLSLVDEFENEYELLDSVFDAPLSAAEVVAVFRDAEPSPLDEEGEWSFSSFFYSDLDEVAADDVDEDDEADADETEFDAIPGDRQAAMAMAAVGRRRLEHDMSLDDIVEYLMSRPGSARVVDQRPAVVIVAFEDGSGVAVHAKGMDLLEPSQSGPGDSPSEECASRQEYQNFKAPAGGKCRDFMIFLGPPGPPELKEQYEQFSRNSGKHAEAIWVEFVHHAIEKVCTRSHPDDENSIDRVFSSILGVPVRVEPPFLTSMFRGHPTEPGVIWRPDQIRDLSGKPVEVDWTDKKAISALADVLAYVVQAEGARYVITFEN